MGIKGLWGLLTPYSEKKSLHEIRGETIAVDLSGWICDSQNVTDYYIQPKLYLRNLFFRTIYLLLADIHPVFVLEGDAPELKRDVMAARNAIQFKGAAPKSDKACTRKPDVARKRFKGVLKECESLLKCMGVRCIKGRGEAEATCAQLNAQGLVDAVVSQDSDCFAYGAKRVYRNFSVSSSGGGGSMSGSVDCYDAENMYKNNGFGRKKMVALAILCGCDYGIGACGSSINTVLSFLHTIPDETVIPRLLSWVTDPDEYERQTCWVSVPGRCDRCGHAGRTHTRNGCPVCATNNGCRDTGHKLKLTNIKRELSLRSRALSSCSSGIRFPEPKVMKEFLETPQENIDLEALKTPAPSLIRFVNLMSFKLDWSQRYCVEKFLPLLTKWHLQERVPCMTLKPIRILKKRTPKGVPSFEVVWSDIDGQYEALIPDDQFDVGEDRSAPWTSIERQDLMRQYYPQLVEAYEDSIKKPVKEKKTRRRKKKEKMEEDEAGIEINVDVIKSKRKHNIKAKNKIDNNRSQNSNLTNVSVSVNKLKRKRNAKKVQKTIDSFIANKRRKSNKKSGVSSRISSRITPMNYDSLSSNDIVKNSSKEKENAYNADVDSNKENDRINLRLSMLTTIDKDDDTIDVSDIVESIIQRNIETKFAQFNNKVYKLVYDKSSTPKKTVNRKSLNGVCINCSTPTESPIRRPSFRNIANISNRSYHKVSNSYKNISNCSISNTSYFFDKLTDDRDVFELSMDYTSKRKSAVLSINNDTTLNYSLPDVHL